LKRWMLSFLFIAQTSFGVQLIELQSEVQAPPNSSLSLWDLVEPASAKNANDIQSKLVGQSLMVVPALGERTELSFQSIADHLKLALSSTDRLIYKFSIPRRVTIQSQSPKLTKEVVSEILKREWQALCDKCQIEILDVTLPIGEFAKWQMDVPKTLPRGSFNLPLISYDPTGKESRFWVQGRLDILKEVPIAQRALYVGERVREEDFKYSLRSITHATDGAPSKEFLVGGMVKTPVAANQVIWSQNLLREKALKKGDMVRVITQGKMWELSAPAIAEQDGEVGDTVTLKNLSSQKKLTGLVVGKGEVEIK